MADVPSDTPVMAPSTRFAAWWAVPLLIAIGASLFLVLAVLALRHVTRRAYRIWSVAAEAELAKDRQTLLALKAANSLEFPMAVMPANAFRQMGKLHTHETMRKQLVFLDTIDELAGKEFPILFLSHQWINPSHPDPMNEQYPLMVRALDAIVAARGWELDQVRVWLDYFSVPQANVTCQRLAIDSIFVYARESDAFCAVAPLAGDRSRLDALSYTRRMWCRAEMLLFSLKNGTEQMWLATDDGTLSGGRPTPGAARIERMPASFVENSMCLNVFEGEATKESDKEGLVTPLLGMYGVLYARHCGVQGSVVEGALGGGAGDDERLQRGLIARLLDQATRDAIFPPYLFGDLCTRMERIAKDAATDVREVLQYELEAHVMASSAGRSSSRRRSSSTYAEGSGLAEDIDSNPGLGSPSTMKRLSSSKAIGKILEGRVSQRKKNACGGLKGAGSEKRRQRRIAAQKGASASPDMSAWEDSVTRAQISALPKGQGPEYDAVRVDKVQSVRTAVATATPHAASGSKEGKAIQISPLKVEVVSHTS